MVEVTTVAFVAGGAVLLLAGAAISTYGVGLLGVLLGGGGGYLIAPTVGGFVGLEGLLAVAAGIAVGALAGLVATFFLLSIAIAVMSFGVGTFIGVNFVAGAMGESGILAWVIGLGIGIAAAVLGNFMTKTMMVLISSLAGAALVSQSVTFANLQTAQTEIAMEPLLFDPYNPVFLGFVALGVLSQFGLFKLGYVAKLVTVVPGAILLQDRGEEG